MAFADMHVHSQLPRASAIYVSVLYMSKRTVQARHGSYLMQCHVTVPRLRPRHGTIALAARRASAGTGTKGAKHTYGLRMTCKIEI